MNENKSNNSSGGIGFFGLLQVALIVLKLCKVINCSWFVVFTPLWIYLLLIIIIICLLA